MRSAWSISVLFPLVWILPAFGQETAKLMPLPEGDRGIAAKYPNDAGIGGDPAVVFTDGFEGFEDETVATGSRPQKGNKWDTVVHTVRITREPKNVHSGKRAVELRHEEPMSHAVGKRFKDGFETIYVRYYLKYHEKFLGCHHTGVSLWALAPGQVQASGAANSATGVRPNGHNHFLVGLDTAPPWTRLSDRAPGKSNIYCYHMDQGRRWGDMFFPSGTVYPPENSSLFGKSFVPRPDFNVELDRWYCYELMLRTNTPDQRDGRVAFWIDGRLVGDFPNLRFRDVATLKVNILNVGSYSSSRHANTIMWYDDVVAATSYIGPMVRTAKPTNQP